MADPVDIAKLRELAQDPLGDGAGYVLVAPSSLLAAADEIDRLREGLDSDKVEIVADLGAADARIAELVKANEDLLEGSFLAAARIAELEEQDRNTRSTVDELNAAYNRKHTRVCELEALLREARDWIDHPHHGRGLPKDECCRFGDRIDAALGATSLAPPDPGSPAR